MTQSVTDKNTILEIKHQLKSMYVQYNFRVNKNDRTEQFEVTVFHGTQNISTLKVDSNTPINNFWATVKEWMKPILSYNNH